MPTCISTDFNRKHVCLKRDNKPKILAVPRTQKCFFFFFAIKQKRKANVNCRKWIIKNWVCKQIGLVPLFLYTITFSAEQTHCLYGYPVLMEMTPGENCGLG